MRRFITTAGCLLTLAVIGATLNTQAQVGGLDKLKPSEIDGAPVNQKSSTADSSGEREPLPDPQIIRSPFKQSRWFSRMGYAVAAYHSSTAIATNGQPLSGGSAQASNNMTLTFDVGYELTKSISVSMMSGIPVKPHVTGEGTAESLGILGKVRYGPAMFTGYYRFPKVGRFRPYVGGGAAYAIIFKEFDGSVKQLKVHNNWGSVLQGGAEYEVNSNYTVFVDFKEVWLAVNAHGVLSDGTGVNARVKLNPSLVSVGIKFRLPFGHGH